MKQDRWYQIKFTLVPMYYIRTAGREALWILLLEGVDDPRAEGGAWGWGKGWPPRVVKAQELQNANSGVQALAQVDACSFCMEGRTRTLWAAELEAHSGLQRMTQFKNRRTHTRPAPLYWQRAEYFARPLYCTVVQWYSDTWRSAHKAERRGLDPSRDKYFEKTCQFSPLKIQESPPPARQG